MSDNQEILAAISRLRDRIQSEDLRHLQQIDRFNQFHRCSMQRLYEDLAEVKRLVKAPPQPPVP